MYKTLLVKYFQVTSKKFSSKSSKWWLNTKAVGTKGSITRPLELVVRAITLTTGRLTITVRVVSPVTGLPTSIDKTSSSIIGPLTPAARSRFGYWSLVRCLRPSNCQYRSLVRHLLHQIANTNHRSWVISHYIAITVELEFVSSFPNQAT